MSRTSLTISTILGEQKETGDSGPFLLAAVQGVEAISQPFAFDLTLYRSIDSEDVDPSMLIGTSAKFGIKHEKTYLTRTGVFQAFEKAGTNEIVATSKTDFMIYRARLVPAIKLLDYEQVFRVFENMTVMDIIKEAVGSFANINPSTYLVPRFGADTFPPIDYCVQFNETTLNFISRLMAAFGIWYYFEHPGPSDATPVERMVLGRTPVKFDKCLKPDMVATYKDLNDRRVRGFGRGYQIAHRKLRSGDYAVLKPAEPVWSDEVSILNAYDAMPADDSFGRVRRRDFPAALPQLDGQGDPHALKTDAENRLAGEEAGVFGAEGQSKNRTFRAGQVFDLKEDSEANDVPGKNKDMFGPSVKGEYLLTRVAIAAIEHALGRHFFSDLLNLFNPLHWLHSADKGLADVPGVIANTSLAGWLEDEAKHVVWPSSPAGSLSTVLSGPGGLLGGLFGVLLDNLKEIVKVHGDEYGNSFTAVPWKPGKFAKLPLPLYTPVVAQGPQLAVVIGPKGLADNGTDIYADALGRVRVRFPWHDELPEGGEQDPWKTDRRTAWVRVSEGWAGAGMGTQFLPRIGDEVVVSYLDGNPARPLITGRLYNASNGAPGLPFPPNRAAAKPVDAKYVHAPSPAGSFLRSGIATRSSVAPNKQTNRFHMLRFDDAWHDEQLLIRSQGRTDVTSFGVWHDTSHGNRHIRVGGKDPDTGKGGGALIITTGDEYDLHVGADRYEGVDKKYQLSVKADSVFDLQGAASTVVGKKYELNAREIVLEAATKITLKVGSSFVVVDPAGVFIKGAIVQINSGGAPGTTGDHDVTDPLDAGTADPGTPPDWLARQPPPGKGGRRHHTAHAQHGLTLTRNPDGSMQVGRGIRVAGDPAYQDTVVQQLAQIDQTPTGHAMLDDYQSTSRNMTIQPRPATATVPNAQATATDPAAAKNGTGSDSTVAYSPNQFPAPVAPDVPGDVVLFHEMTHAQHNAHGTNARDSTRADNFDNDEEFNTIQQENQYRDDRGIRRRADHHSL